MMTERLTSDFESAAFLQELSTKFPGPMTGLLGTMGTLSFDDFKAEVLNAALPLERYKWLEPLRITLEQSVADYLYDNPPDHKALEPNFYEDHFNDASELITACIGRAEDIHDLEAQAFNTALNYLLTETMQPGALKLAKLNLMAARKQAGADAADADDSVLDMQDLIQTRMREMSLKMHDTAGHALNYAERIKFLREIQGRDIRSVYEKLTAARWGIACCTGIQLPFIPEWDGQKGDNLEKLARWTSQGARRYEEARRSEYVVRRILRLGSDNLISGGQQELARRLTKFDGSTRMYELPFDVTNESLGLSEFDRPRLIGLGIGVLFRDTLNQGFIQTMYTEEEEVKSRYQFVDIHSRKLRSEFRFSADVIQPKQGGEANYGQGDQSYWDRLPIELRDEIAECDVAGNGDAMNIRSPQIKNTNPLGRWKIVMHDSFSGYGFNPSIAINLMKAPTPYEMMTIEDIVMVMTMVVRSR